LNQPKVGYLKRGRGAFRRGPFAFAVGLSNAMPGRASQKDRQKSLIFRAFSRMCGKSPNFLRFFGVAPLYLARNAVKSGFSLIR